MLSVNSTPEQVSDPKSVVVSSSRTPGAQVVVLVLVSAGGGLGALVRWGWSVGWPHDPGQFPWATLATNLVGCAAIGVFLAVVEDRKPGWEAARLFLGVGVLGGFTTFSTYVVDQGLLVSVGEPWLALGYGAGTLIGALVATWGAATATGWLTRWSRRAR